MPAARMPGRQLPNWPAARMPDKASSCLQEPRSALDPTRWLPGRSARCQGPPTRSQAKQRAKAKSGQVGLNWGRYVRFTRSAQKCTVKVTLPIQRFPANPLKTNELALRVRSCKSYTIGLPSMRARGLHWQGTCMRQPACKQESCQLPARAYPRLQRSPCQQGHSEVTASVQLALA